MKRVVFTLCSNNYLANAKCLIDSIVKVAPDTHCIIGLVDNKSDEIDYSFFAPAEVVPFDEIGYPVFDDMLKRYNIIEFNTAVKPFYIEYLFNRFGTAPTYYYIDPDIVFFEGFEELDSLLDEYNFVLTPHLTEPPETVTTDELVAMRHGHFNLGFLGIKNSTEGNRFIKWWKTRLTNHCVIDKPRGLFVDQKWVNLAPLYFDGMFNFKHQGYNMAWWNMGERKLIEQNGKYYVNNLNQPLVFFHFSGYKPGANTYFGRTDVPEYSLENRKDMVEIFNWYGKALIENDYKKLWSVKPRLKFAELPPKKQSTLSRLKRAIKI